MAAAVSSSSLSSIFHTDVVVIGAGVIGLAVTRALTLVGREVVLLEKESRICTGTSSRNSEVIHGGLYYPSSSNKAKWCVQGKDLLYNYCIERQIPYKQCGKLIVATNETQMKTNLPSLLQQAHANGVTDVRLLSKADVEYLEPNLDCFGALLSPSTGVLDSHTYYQNLFGDCEGASVALQTKVSTMDVMMDNENKVCVKTDDGTWITANHVINCSGLYASLLATKLHQTKKKNMKIGPITSQWQPPKQYFAKGTYFRLKTTGGGPFTAKSSTTSSSSSSFPGFQHLIYPIPEPGGLGVHATIDWSGNGIKFGPDVEWLPIEQQHPDDIDYTPNPDRGDKFYNEIRKYWPNLQDGQLVVDYVGVRPKLSHPLIGMDGMITTKTTTAPFDDFQIVGPETHGINGLIHLFGIESPGLTSSLAIAEHVRHMVLTTDRQSSWGDVK